MVVFRIEPFPGLNDLSGDFCPVGVEVFLLYLLGHPLGDVLLGWRVVEDGGAILGPAIFSLSIESGRVMCAIEEFNELSVGHDVWVELDPQGLSMVRGTGTNFSVFGIVGVSSGIPDGGLEDPLVLGRRVVLQEYMFNSPETAPCKSRDFGSNFGWGRHGIERAIERC